MQATQERRQSIPRSSLYADVLVELTLLTFRNFMFTVLLGGAGLVGTSMLLARHYHDRTLWLIAFLMLAIAVLRVACVALFWLRRNIPLTLRSAIRWQIAHAVLTFAFASTVAATTLYNFRVHDATAWTLCTIGAFMLCAGLASRVALYPLVIQASGIAMLLALAVAALLSHDPVARVGVLLICLFAALFCQSVNDKFETSIEQLRSRRTLRMHAEHDTLTGCSNRRHFEESLAALCQSEAPLAILFIDLDRFKAVNDSFGRSVGDILLQRVAVRLRASVRRGDLVARVAENEFAILQSQGASQQAAESLARRINRAVAATFEIDGHHILVGTSIGIRLSSPTDKDPVALLDKTDEAVYSADDGRFAGINRHPPAA